MEDINWPHVREVVLNDAPSGPNITYLRKFYRMFPDLRIHGFFKSYDGSWTVVMETICFPYHVEVWGTRSPVPSGFLVNYLPKKEGVKSST